MLLSARMPYRVVGVGLVTMILGCTGSSLETPDTVPVTGTVTYKGSPVEGATVLFSPPATATAGYAASGKTDSSGKYTLSTFFTASVQEEGAVPGDYVVTISKMEQAPMPERPPADASPEEIERFQRERAMKSAGRQPVPEAPKSLIPQKYSNATTSQLKETVPAEGGTFDYTLED